MMHREKHSIPPNCEEASDKPELRDILKDNASTLQEGQRHERQRKIQEDEGRFRDGAY